MRSDQRQRSMQRKAHRRCAAALRITSRISFVNHPRAVNRAPSIITISALGAAVGGGAQQRKVRHVMAVILPHIFRNTPL